MTVRWKPLLVLSGLFVVIAVVGIVAIAATLLPRKSSGILAAARSQRRAGKFEQAQIYYRQALQVDGKNPSVHEEMAAMCGEWARKAPAEKKPEILKWRFISLVEATKYGKTLRDPRRQLLLAALEADETPEGVHWARELLDLDPTDPDAHFQLAAAMLEDHTPAVPEIKRHIAALEEAKAPAVRLAWLRARLGQVAGDTAARESALAPARSLSLPDTAGPVDRTALVQLRALDAETTTDAARLPERVKALQSEATSLAGAPDVAPNRIVRLSLVFEHVQSSLSLLASKADAATKPAITKLVDAIEGDVESIFTRSIASGGKADLSLYLTYAQHLRFRNQPARCLEVVGQAKKSPAAALPNSKETVLKLHAVAAEASLGDTNDAERFGKAAPHIQELLTSSHPRFQGLGHLFQGAIELEQSGVAGTPTKDGQPLPASPAAVQPKLRSSALNHLKLAADLLPDVVEAQARYGVALVLAQEPALGRQYLHNAIRLGQADPHYHLWAAWSMVQAGYPEEAEPIVRHLAGEIAAGRVTKDLEPTLHLLEGEILQTRKSPDDLKKAIAEYDRSYAGKVAPASVQLRMAQIDVQLGQPQQALKRIEQLRALGQGGPPAEHLAVLILLDTKRTDEAMKVLAKARAANPESDELVALEGAVLLRNQKPKDADKVLADFLAKRPENVNLVLMRAQIQSDLLNEPKEARRLLVNVADTCENSAPLVQLALLDLKEKDYDAVATTVAKIRARWKDAASADVLDAQLALVKNDLELASKYFGEALRKDPGNKIVQFYKAQVDSRRGDRKGATQALEQITAQGTTKELDTGVTLAVAAHSALATMALQEGRVDAAIRRYESLRAAPGTAPLARGDRWQLARAYNAKGQWPDARREIAALVNDKQSPPSTEERVLAADFYRVNKEEGPALEQLDYVLSAGVEPHNPEAIIAKAYLLADAKQTAAAADLIRKAIADPGKEKPPAKFFLVLAGMECVLPPEADAARRAIGVLDQGLALQPKSLELTQAKYKALNGSQGGKAAVEFVESAAKADPDGDLTRLLADVYREQNDLESAERVLRGLVEKNPKESRLAAVLVRVTALQAVQAGDQGDRTRERSRDERLTTLIREFRTRYPSEVVFLQEDFEQALRHGDSGRAASITKEIDGLAKNAPTGPILRARLYAAQGKTQEVAAAYAEALDRDPTQPDVRVRLAQTELQLGRVDEALRQARAVRESNEDRGDALLLEAQALAYSPGTPAQQTAARDQAVSLLAASVKKQPKFAPAYRLIAEIRLAQGQPDGAIASLRQSIDAGTDDGMAVAQLVELLARPATPGATPAPDRLAALQALTGQISQRDARGNLMLGIAIGYHKADQYESALSWIEKTEAKLEAPAVHLNHGDILLTIAEHTPDAAQARPYFEKAVAQYDLVLKNQANSVEAVNNKAWILHSYLEQSPKALELATTFLSRVDPATLPGEFFDTLGAIQEAVGKPRDAEESYNRGLRKAPEHPVLNFHMGRLLVSDPQRRAKARDYLLKAQSGRNRLSPAMAAEVATLVAREHY